MSFTPDGAGMPMAGKLAGRLKVRMNESGDTALLAASSKLCMPMSTAGQADAAGDAVAKHRVAARTTVDESRQRWWANMKGALKVPRGTCTRTPARAKSVMWVTVWCV